MTILPVLILTRVDALNEPGDGEIDSEVGLDTGAEVAGELNGADADAILLAAPKLLGVGAGGGVLIIVARTESGSIVLSCVRNLFAFYLITHEWPRTSAATPRSQYPPRL